MTNVKNSNQESEKNDKVDQKEEKTENKVPVDLPDESSYDNDESYNYDYGDNHCHDLICNTDDLQPLWGINSNTVIKKYKVCEVFANRGCIERAACEFKRGGNVLNVNTENIEMFDNIIDFSYL